MLFSYLTTIAFPVVLFFLSICSAEKTEGASEGVCVFRRSWCTHGVFVPKIVLIRFSKPSPLTPTGTPHSTSAVQQQCSVCWSTESAGHCQHGVKTEPCSDDQLDATVSKLRLINPTARMPVADNSSTGGHLGRQHKCYTLSATTGGVGASRKVFYAKGCTTAAIDPCAGWAKENGGDCELCTGSNCNAAAPVELGRNVVGLSEGKTKHSGADTIRNVNGLTVVLMLAGVLLMGCANSN
ncbi:hypothetical protein ZHAS_00010418 [Anopheles sinensis]|uniref:Uncharacterized protein n=1 Tax=Anopheles sinensis TaxID=74873 RepID=A0A084VXI8_ANOSI|nr:hypothetical protein ZHAS_00010418 [Anopheles sinensis]